MPPDGSTEAAEIRVRRCAELIAKKDTDVFKELRRLKEHYHRWAYVEALDNCGDDPDVMLFILLIDDSCVDPLYTYCHNHRYEQCKKVLCRHCEKIVPVA